MEDPIRKSEILGALYMSLAQELAAAMEQDNQQQSDNDYNDKEGNDNYEDS